MNIICLRVCACRHVSIENINCIDKNNAVDYRHSSSPWPFLLDCLSLLLFCRSYYYFVVNVVGDGGVLLSLLMIT